MTCRCLARPRSQDHPPLAAPRTLPALAQHVLLGLAIDEGREPAGHRGLQSTPCAARSVHAIEAERVRNALQRVLSLVIGHEQPGEQVIRVGADEHAVRRGERLHTARDVRRVPEDVDQPAASFAHDGRAGVHADPHGEADTARGLEPPIEGTDLVDDGEGGAHRALGIVTVGPRMAEARHHTVAQILDDVSPGPFDRGGDGAEIHRDDVSPLLGIHPRHQVGGSDQIGEDDGEPAPFPAGRHGGTVPGARRHRRVAGGAGGRAARNGEATGWAAQGGSPR